MLSRLVRSVPASAVVRQSASVRRFASASSRRSRTHFGIVFVPQQEAYIVERFGKFANVLEPGLQFLIPFVDRIAYIQSLKVETVDVKLHTAIFTRDNVSLEMDGVLYYQVLDAKKASYSVEDAAYAIRQLAVSTMRSEIGQLTLDETLRERQALNHRMVIAINDAVRDYGMQCQRFEVREISPQQSIVQAMELEAVAERRRRQQVIESEGEKRAAINIAEGEKAAKVLASEALAAETVNLRRGEADGIKLTAEAQAAALKIVAEALKQAGGSEAAALGVAQQYVDAFSNLARSSTTLMLPSQSGDVSAMVAQAMGIYQKLQQQQLLQKNADEATASPANAI